MARFNEEKLQVDDYDEKVTISTFIRRLRSKKLIFSLSKAVPTTMNELLWKAKKHVNGEETVFTRLGHLILARAKVNLAPIKAKMEEKTLRDGGENFKKWRSGKKQRAKFTPLNNPSTRS